MKPTTKPFIKQVAFHRSSTLMFACLASAAVACAQANDPADQAMNTIRPEAIRAGIRFLSDDALRAAAAKRSDDATSAALVRAVDAEKKRRADELKKEEEKRKKKDNR